MMPHGQRDERRVAFGGIETPDGFLYELTGGRLCLDLTNTLDERMTDHPRELLRSPHDLFCWAEQAGALTPDDAGVLQGHAARHERLAGRALARVMSLREHLFALFSAIARRMPVPGEPLAALNVVLAGAAVHRCLEVRDSVVAWNWRPVDDPDRVLWSAAWSAADLLTSTDVGRIRRCAGAGCAWLFLDTSKNRTRRWCDMTVCGNRAKARRHYAKGRTAVEVPGRR
jgi:predicted RNA-binding Zn ribbon-like protein